MSDNITITFPDGNTKSVEKGTSGLDLANQISKSLAKESVAIQINGKVSDLSLELNQDCKVVIIIRDNEEALDYNLLNTNISNGLNPNQSSWDEISDLAFRTYVPESEESREKGAGGGDAND